jgi:hypothetical protein
MTQRAMVTDEAGFNATLQQARQAVDAVQRTLQLNSLGRFWES